MSYLLSFDIDKRLDFVPDGFEPKNGADNPTEKSLFEALWIMVKAVPPSGSELEAAINLKQDLRAQSVEGGSIKLMLCPCCNQRWMRHDKTIRTLDKSVDFIIDSDSFVFMKSCMDRWNSISAELQEYFMELKQRFKTAEEKTPEQWKKFVADRDAKIDISATGESRS